MLWKFETILSNNCVRQVRRFAGRFARPDSYREGSALSLRRAATLYIIQNGLFDHTYFYTVQHAPFVHKAAVVQPIG